MIFSEIIKEAEKSLLEGIVTKEEFSKFASELNNLPSFAGNESKEVIISNKLPSKFSFDLSSNARQFQATLEESETEFSFINYPKSPYYAEVNLILKQGLNGKKKFKFANVQWIGKQPSWEYAENELNIVNLLIFEEGKRIFAYGTESTEPLEGELKFVSVENISSSITAYGAPYSSKLSVALGANGQVYFNGVFKVLSEVTIGKTLFTIPYHPTYQRIIHCGDAQIATQNHNFVVKIDGEVGVFSQSLITSNVPSLEGANFTLKGI